MPLWRNKENYMYSSIIPVTPSYQEHSNYIPGSCNYVKGLVM